MFSLVFTRIFATKLYFKEWRARIRNYTRKEEIRFLCKRIQNSVILTYFPDSNNPRFKKYADTCGRAGP